MGIGVGDLDAFVASLTPVVLRADTAVTDYGYDDNAYQPYPATLQAGTSVLINSYGEPTVKCFSGDPLGRPTLFNSASSYSGESWAGFRPDKVCRIEPAAAPVRTFTFIDTASGKRVTKAGKPDPKSVKGPNPDLAAAGRPGPGENSGEPGPTSDQPDSTPIPVGGN